MVIQFRLPLFIPDAYPLVRQLEHMAYDDALLCASWRVEYLQCGVESPHYRVFFLGQLVGIVEVSARRNLPVIREWLAIWLLAQGWRIGEGRIVEGGALTTWSARKTGLVRLWEAT